MPNNVKTTVEELRKLINVDNVIGTPIETEDKILIPVMRMGVGFGAGENILGKENSDASGAGAGVEPTSMVMIPKKGNDSEGVRALSEIGLIITDLVKTYLGGQQSNEYYDEGEYIEPEFSHKNIDE